MPDGSGFIALMIRDMTFQLPNVVVFMNHCLVFLMLLFVQRWVIACWTCLGKLAPRGQRLPCVYLSSDWMWLSSLLTMLLLCCLCFGASSSKSSVPFCRCVSTFHSGELNMVWTGHSPGKWESGLCGRWLHLICLITGSGFICEYLSSL